MSTQIVSIVTAAFNAEEHLEDTFDCLRSQTYEDWEWLVTDDGSSDTTFDVLKRFAREDSRVKPTRLPLNSGAAVARNASLDRACGQYIAFLDADDYWYETKLQRQLSFMADKRVEFSFSPYEIWDENLNSCSKLVDIDTPDHCTYKDLLGKRVTLGCSTVMVTADLLADRRMIDIRTGQDYEFWLRLLKDGAVAHKVPFPLTKYRVHANSISRNKVKKAIRQWSIYRNILHLGIVPASFYFCLYAYRAVFRK